MNLLFHCAVCGNSAEDGRLCCGILMKYLLVSAEDIQTNLWWCSSEGVGICVAWEHLFPQFKEKSANRSFHSPHLQQPKRMLFWQRGAMSHRKLLGKGLKPSLRWVLPAAGRGLGTAPPRRGRRQVTQEFHSKIGVIWGDVWKAQFPCRPIRKGLCRL